MTNPEKLKCATELLAARGQGFSDGLRWVLRMTEPDQIKNHLDHTEYGIGGFNACQRITDNIHIELEKPNG